VIEIAAGDQGSLDGAVGNREFLFQRKTSDYPVKYFAGALCLFGGNADPGDASPFATLERELREELPNRGVADAVLAGLVDPTGENSEGETSESHRVEWWRPFLIEVDREGTGRDRGYAFMCTMFHARVSRAALGLPAAVETTEGTADVLNEEELTKERFAWGYGRVVSEALGRTEGFHTDGAVAVTALLRADAARAQWAPPPKRT
jgi:NUDIX domain